MRIIQPEELTEDYTELLKFTIPGPPRTKKNNQRIFRKMILPSKQYVEYETNSKQYCLDAWKNKNKEPMDFGVAMIMHVWLERWMVGDCVGYHQSIMDILEKWEVVANDKWIHTTDYNPITKTSEHWFKGVDKANPRVELTLYRFRHPYEEFRKDKEIKEAGVEERRAIRESKKLSKSPA